MEYFKLLVTKRGREREKGIGKISKNYGQKSREDNEKGKKKKLLRKTGNK